MSNCKFAVDVTILNKRIPLVSQLKNCRRIIVCVERSVRVQYKTEVKEVMYYSSLPLPFFTVLAMDAFGLRGSYEDYIVRKYNLEQFPSSFRIPFEGLCETRVFLSEKHNRSLPSYRPHYPLQLSVHSSGLQDSTPICCQLSTTINDIRNSFVTVWFFFSL